MVARDDIVCRRAMWSLNTTGTGTWTGRGGECIIGEHGEYISEDIGVFHHLRRFIGLLIHDGQVVYRSFRCHIVICNVYGVIWRVYSVYSIVRLQVVVWSVYRIVITHKQPYRCEECFKSALGVHRRDTSYWSECNRQEEYVNNFRSVR